MNLYVIDFESTFSSENTLTKHSIEEYVRHPKFEPIGLGIKSLSHGWTRWFPHDQASFWLATHGEGVEGEGVAFIAHHAQFDGFILKHVYGFRPAFWFDTLSMSRAIYQHAPSHSLDSLAKMLNLGTPKTVPYNEFRNKTVAEIEAVPGLMAKIGNGCLHDIELTHKLFELLVSQMPEDELELIDETIRLYTEPVLVGDVPLLTEALTEAIVARESKMHELGLTGDVLKSDRKFATLLRGAGVEPPTKVSSAPTKAGQSIFAFAKSDKAFTDLLEHPDERVRDIVEARIATKTSIHETRAGRLLTMAGRGSIPVYLKYYGAHTGRYAGGDKANLQNLPKDSKLRSSLLAPEGHVLVWGDLSQIELRLTAWLADCQSLLAAFSEGRDIYSEDGTAFFGMEVSKKVNPDLRFLSKETDLGCCFGMGPDKFHLRLQHKCREFGYPIPEFELAKKLVKAFRRKYPQISDKLWGTFDEAIDEMGRVPDFELDYKCLRYEGKKVILPNDMWLDYSDLHWYREERKGHKDYGKEGWRTGNVWFWGGSQTEHFAQSLDRVLMFLAMLEVRRAFDTRSRGRIVHQVHDELICCVPLTDKQWCLDMLGSALVTVPAWASSLPLAAELFSGLRYDKSECEAITRRSE
jgi:DNA polymerase family A